MKKLIIHPIKRRIAKYYLIFLRKFFHLKVIGITGSAGKTSTKEMLASILRLRGKTVATYANIDPVYNIPTTILKCTPLTEYLVLEMGVEYQGEMDFYLWLAKPDIVVITNIYPTHTEFFKDERGVFKEKKKLAEALGKTGVAILNKEDPILHGFNGRLSAKIVWFGKAEAEAISKEIHLPILGEQFAENAAAAATCASLLGAKKEEIKTGLESFIPPEHRMRVLKHKTGAIILDDTYNNNPRAAREALKTFASFAKNKKKIIIMGDMLELGTLEEKYHREIGALIGMMDIDLLIGVGLASKLMVEEATKALGPKRTKWVPSEAKVRKVLGTHLSRNAAVLIKGSRSIHLERVVESIIK